MGFLYHTFPVSGVETWVWLPPLVAFVISLFTAMGGVSGAFLLLPFQVSVLGFTSPAVSATNQVFNIAATPSGAYRYFREGRMLWPLGWTLVAGAVPGIVLGALIRLHWLPDPTRFKLFAGLVLAYIGVRLIADMAARRSRSAARATERWDSGAGLEFVTLAGGHLRYGYGGRIHEAKLLPLLSLSLAVGTVGGVYGIGGGAMIAPLLVALLGLPVHTVAGATLFATLVTSVAGVLCYQLLAPFYPTLSVAPDWTLGLLFGAGGAAGMYCGACLQRWVPEVWIKGLLALCLLVPAGGYIAGFLLATR